MPQQQESTYQPLTPQEYARTFSSYQQITDCYHHMASLLVTVTKGMQGSHLDLLSIGAGSGCFEDAMIKCNGLLVEYFYAFEPDESRRKELEKIAPTWNVDYFIDERCFGDESETDRQFDLVLMSHVLYIQYILMFV